jgi:integrase
MAKYTRRAIQFGEWFLYLRQGSPAYYRARYSATTGKLERFSLGTISAEEASERLEAWWLQNRKVSAEKPSDASLADVLRRYWENHGQHLPSASGNRDALSKWLNYWQEACISELSVEAQEAFVRHLEGLDLKRSTIQRTINIGKAAISRAFKRGELAAMPFILSVTVKGHPPKGRPMEVAELVRLYGESAPHLQTFIRWALGTAARPQAIIELRSQQVEWAHGVVHLNPEGREQNKKHRPVVKLPRKLAGEVFEGWLLTHRGRHAENVKTARRAAVRRAGLDAACRPYSLRHTAARWMRLHGVPAEEVSQQLGHRRLGTTGVYTEYDPEYLKAACEALDALLQALLAKNLPDGSGPNRKTSGKSTNSCRSSVVEHSLGKGEVLGSIPSGSTTRKTNRTGHNFHF